jgi:GNAT superfamily N-acetyltransferase
MAPAGRNALVDGDWVLRVLAADEYSCLSWFDCGDDEINDFFCNDALPHKLELMAVSYVLEYGGRPIALVSVQNDSIHFEDTQSRIRMKFGKDIGLPYEKRYSSIPAVKLGRVGVHKDYTGEGFGSRIIELCKRLFLTENRTGCRLVTVDAYVSKVKFYEKNGFILFPGQSV